MQNRTTALKTVPRKGKKISWKKDFKHNGSLYLLFIPTLIFFFIFSYIPMFGILMSFQDVSISKGVFGSEWIGFDNFKRLFQGDQFWLVMRNTSIMALLNLTIGFIVPVILGLIVSEIGNKFYKRAAQTVTYMPYFVSTVVIVELVKVFVSSDGAITFLLSLFGMEKQNLLSNPNPPVFWFINCFTDIWQCAGYSSIIFVAAIANVDKDMHEAAVMDGANRFQRILHITIPSILPTIIMMFTIKVGTIFTTGFDKVLLLYNSGIWDTADCLTTYTYRMAFYSGDYGLSTASGLFQSVISTVLLLVSNWLSRKFAKTSLV